MTLFRCIISKACIFFLFILISCNLNKKNNSRNKDINSLTSDDKPFDDKPFNVIKKIDKPLVVIIDANNLDSFDRESLSLFKDKLSFYCISYRYNCSSELNKIKLNHFFSDILSIYKVNRGYFDAFILLINRNSNFLKLNKLNSICLNNKELFNIDDQIKKIYRNNKKAPIIIFNNISHQSLRILKFFYEPSNNIFNFIVNRTYFFKKLNTSILKEPYVSLEQIYNKLSNIDLYLSSFSYIPVAIKEIIKKYLEGPALGNLGLKTIPKKSISKNNHDGQEL